jgi:DNA-binding transcriptional LysR family regulator
VSTPPFQQLQAFLAVARHKSFSGAARELGVSRSAVSHTVRQLEEQLRVVLLARTTRSVSLTDAGRRLVDGAGPSLAQVAAALTDVSAQPGETVGRVRLSVPPMAVPFVIEPVVPTFRARHPRVEVEIFCATSASPSARRPRARSTPGSSNAGAGTGASRFAAVSSAPTAA